jgi:hypothetical protein
VRTEPLTRCQNRPIPAKLEFVGHSVLAFRSRTVRKSICLSVAVGLALGATAANAATVRVRAGSRLDGRVEVLVVGDTIAPAQPDSASIPPYQVVISGSLRDDVGDPIPSSRVTISCHASGAVAGAPTIVMPLHDAEPCRTRETETAPPSAASSSEYPLDTDAAGAFCLRSMLPSPPTAVRLRFGGDPFHDPASIDLPADLARPALAIAFEPAPRIVSLDENTLHVDVRLYAPGRAPETGIELGGVRLQLTDEVGRRLGGATSNADGRTHFDVSTGGLREPGPGELRVEIDGSASAFKAHASRSIERHAKVAIVAAGPTSRAALDDGLRVRLHARWARGAVPGGAIEATVGRQSAGSATVRNGVADVTMAFDSSAVADSGVREGATARRVARIDFHYLPDAPWWEPGETTVITVPLRASNPWRRAPLALVALVIGAWMLRGSWQPRGRKDRASGVPGRSTAEHGAIQLTRLGANSDGYRGQVLDAHDGTPLAAVISIVATAFPTPARPRTGDQVAEAHPTPEVETDEHGRFSLRATSSSAGACVRVRAPWHETLEQPLPLPGELTVRLVSRRRHLLSRLVNWSRSERAINCTVPEPTPRQVASGHGGDVGVWASAVEAAAFGPTPVDEQREKTVLMLEPRPGSQSSPR